MKIAAVQIDVTLADPAANVARILEKLQEATRAGAKLAIFPECAITGYCFESLQEGQQVAEPIPGPSTERIAAACRELDCYCVTGLLELDGENVFNAAVLIGPQGVVGSYRKVHLPYLGIDRFTTYGDRPFDILQMGDVNVGLLICYDVGFPEASRILALKGADLIILPTNWPPGAECMAQMSIATRAMENSVYFAAVDRIGAERGFRFIGQSSICDPSGKVLAQASETDEQILYADVVPERARNKRIVRVPDKHIIDRLADRRPEMYGELVKPHSLPTPRQDRS